MSTILKTAAGEASKRSTAPLKVLYFRHAYSHWNKFKDNLDPNSGKQDWVDLDEKFVDAQLTFEEGINQVFTLSNDLTPHIKNIRTVFVSPLVRAIQTADIAFGQHAEHKNIQFILEPLVMSRINHPTDLSFGWKDACAKAVIKFDTSLMDEFTDLKSWQFRFMLAGLDNAHPKRKLFLTVQELLDSSTTPFEAFKKYEKLMKEADLDMEEEKLIKQRIKLLSCKIRKHACTHRLAHEQITLVSHRGVIKRLFKKTKTDNALLLSGEIKYVVASASK